MKIFKFSRTHYQLRGWRLEKSKNQGCCDHELCSLVLVTEWNIINIFYRYWIKAKIMEQSNNGWPIFLKTKERCNFVSCLELNRMLSSLPQVETESSFKYSNYFLWFKYMHNNVTVKILRPFVCILRDTSNLMAEILLWLMQKANSVIFSCF